VDITTTAKDFEMSAAIDQFARNQVRSVLERFSDKILAVDVFMADTNGPKGGIDKQVLIRIRLRSSEVIALQTEHENLYAALKKGSKRARRTVRRHLQKSGRIHKQRMCDHLNDIGMRTAT
jgi:ribosome-associated translation inhibitor RaiA